MILVDVSAGDITVPPGIKEAMDGQARAQIQKKAIILHAEGKNIWCQ